MTELVLSRSLSTSREPGSMGEVFLLSYPSALTKLSYALMAAADMAMVGRLGTTELAAVGLTSVVYMAILSVFMDTVDIVTTFCAQSFGASRCEDGARRAWHGLYLALLSWPLLLLSIPWFGRLLTVLGPSPAVQALGMGYGTVRLMGSGLFLVFIALTGFFRGAGKVRTPLVLILAMNALNVALDYVLIYGKLGLPAMGVAGAAWASNIALAAGAAAALATFLAPGVNRRFRTRRAWRPSLRLLARMVRVGLPAGAQFMVEAVSYALFSALIARIGDVALAASQVVFQIIAVSFNTCWGLSVGAAVLVGQYKGAGRSDVAERGYHNGLRLAGIILAVMIAAMALVPDRLVALFSNDTAVAAAALPIVFLAVVFELFDGLGVIAAGALRGAGDTRFPMIISLAGSLALFLPLAHLFGRTLHYGLIGAWLGATIYIITVSSAYLIRFKTGTWKKLRI